MRGREADFEPKVVVKLAERAAYVCSNPMCNRWTCGPCLADNSKSKKTGKGSHICAASKGGPRYDPNQTPKERQSITNGIWLCASCADLIDKNNGADYPVAQLMKWKKDHEAAINILVESGFNPLAPIGNRRGEASEAQIVEKLFHILEDKGCLYEPLYREVPDYVVLSVDDLRKELRRFREQLDRGTALSERLRAMQEVCRYYMNSTPPGVPSYIFAESLGMLRKSFGFHLNQLQQQYGLTLPPALTSLIPQ
jgi:hypothetical protein